MPAEGSAGASVTGSKSLRASKDDTLYQSFGAQFNNGAGQGIFAGNTSGGDIRRGLIGFNVSVGVPAGSTVTSVSLTLVMSRTTGGAAEVGLHRVLAEWQEGQAVASGNGGAGAAAGPGDVTWTQRALDSLDWTTAGGDFSSAASASVTVEGIGSYTWESTSQLVADVQGWLDDPDSDFGWLLRGDESKTRTAKRFHSDENEDEAIRPVLVVEYRMN